MILANHLDLDVQTVWRLIRFQFVLDEVFIDFLISKGSYNSEEKNLKEKKNEISGYIRQNHKEFRSITEVLSGINNILSL